MLHLLGEINNFEEATKANNGRALPYGAIKKLEANKVGTKMWLTKVMVKYHLKKLNIDFQESSRNALN